MSTALLILTLITGQTVPLEMNLEACKAVASQFQAGAPGYVELNGVHFKIQSMHCEVKT